MSAVSVKDFGRCCRCCLETVGSMTPIYTGCLQDMFNKVMRLEIAPNDGYPQQMCFRCIRRLSAAHTFYNMVVKNHKSIEIVLKDAPGHETSIEKLPSVENVELVVLKSEPDTECIVNIKEVAEPITKPLTKETTWEELSDSEDSHQCPQCVHSRSTQEDMKIHLKTHLYTKEIPKSSKVSPKPAHLCSQCGKGFRLRTSLAKHMRLHRGNFFQCKYCDKRFIEASTLKVHLVSHNLVNPKPFWCGVCKKCFSQKSSLTKHEKLHSSQPGHPCLQCEKTFRHTYSLQRHCLREHELVQCDYCSRSFVGKKNLDMHMKIHRPSNLLDTAEQANKIIDQVDIDIESVKVEFMCMLCVTHFQSKEDLETHLCSSDAVT